MILLAASLAVLSQASRPVILAHYMPWFESKPVSGKWGWHWTMNHFDPDKPGTPNFASHFRPLIGPYDSNDPDALECQVLLMKYAGLDGAIIDWYGYTDVYDYATNHRNTLHFIKHLKRAGLKFAICYEDQTLPNLIKFGKVKEADSLTYGQRLMSWVNKTWFRDPAYVRLNGKPVFLVFGPQFYKGDQWTKMLSGMSVNIYGVNGKYDFPTDGYAWPYPKEGNARTARFYKESSLDRGFLGVAYPRFRDIYAEAKVHESWGSIPDEAGKTFEDTLKIAIDSKTPIIQIATWNDWGEGTQIEPSEEFGYRDLEKIQVPRRSAFKPDDLRPPILLYQLRKSTSNTKRSLDAAAKLLFEGKPKEARALLNVIPLYSNPYPLTSNPYPSQPRGILNSDAKAHSCPPRTIDLEP